MYDNQKNEQPNGLTTYQMCRNQAGIEMKLSILTDDKKCDSVIKKTHAEMANDAI